MPPEQGTLGFTQNRELSWLRFNDRVLDEAMEKEVPLLERLKFLAIFSQNLDEFFMIRVGSLFDLLQTGDTSVDARSGMNPREQLDAIYAAVRPLYRKYEQFFSEVEQQLRLHGIAQLTYGELGDGERKFIRRYFESAVEPILSPQIIDTHHPFPHLQNKVIHAAAVLRYKGREVFGVIPLPTALPPAIFLPDSDARYIRTEELLSANLSRIFDPYQVVEQTLLCITRNADINPDDESYDDVDIDFRKKMKKVLWKRRRLAPVRLELSTSVYGHFKDYLCEKLQITADQIYTTGAPMKPAYAFELPARLSPEKARLLTYKPFKPGIPAELRPGESILRQVQHRDILLSFPYESMAPFLQMLREAAFDPSVISIKITIYRLASKAKLVEYLCAAAENGKDVTVLIELRARFDEQNNIDWSERLEEAGCSLIYGLEGYKVHSKICLITRRERGEIKYVTQIGTGNYNEKTAALYTDVSLLTADQGIAEDANEFFKNMGLGNLYGQYSRLLVAPASLKSAVLAEIDREIVKGREGRIRLKLNSVTDRMIMARLTQASQAGVQIRMIVRGICCLLPGVEGHTENISITSIVGRFLEHSRIYCFGSGAEERIYISSADFMTRNTERRVEIACPVYDPAVREKLHAILEAAEYDNIKARILRPDGTYARKGEDQEPFDSQEFLLEEAQKQTPSPPGPKPGIFRKILRFFGGGRLSCS